MQKMKHLFRFIPCMRIWIWFVWYLREIKIIKILISAETYFHTSHFNVALIWRALNVTVARMNNNNIICHIYIWSMFNCKMYLRLCALINNFENKRSLQAGNCKFLCVLDCTRSDINSKIWRKDENVCGDP